MLAASLGEAAACLVRVPTEVVKAKMQTARVSDHTGRRLTLRQTVAAVLRETNGAGWSSSVTGGLYRGYGITLFREIPFAAIQFPLYERLKVMVAQHYDQPHGATPLQAAACGSASGAVAAAATTPLDVLKTRLMLGADRHGVLYNKGVGDVLRRTVQEEGAVALWAGVQPRVLWITLGGFVFFGA